MTDTDKNSDDIAKKQRDADVKFIKMADLFIEEANKKCQGADHQLVNASMLYATARFSAFITASMSESKENYEAGMDQAIEFYLEEFKKMLQEHMKQYKKVFDKKPRYEH